jgi:hypothetical protein
VRWPRTRRSYSGIDFQMGDVLSGHWLQHSATVSVPLRVTVVSSFRLFTVNVSKPVSVRRLSRAIYARHRNVVPIRPTKGIVNTPNRIVEADTNVMGYLQGSSIDNAVGVHRNIEKPL